MANINHLFYSFNPGEFVRYSSPAGDAHIGRILSVSQHTVTVQRWLLDSDRQQMDSVYLPLCYLESAEHQVIPMPRLSSLVYMVKSSDITDFKVRFVYGMTNVIGTRSRDVFFHHVQQSLTFIIFECLSRISLELQRLLCNRRENQQCFSSVSLQLSELTWRYIVEILQVEEHHLTKVNTFSSLSGRDLSTTRVSLRSACKVLRVEDSEALLRFISIFGVSAVVGVRKRPPKVVRLRANDTKSSVREGALKTDVINLIDTTRNVPICRQKFKFNAGGNKGVDLIFFPDQSCLKISVRYSSFVLHDALNKLHVLRIADEQQNRQALTDDELEILLNC
jgi:hypothetical protein